jgi:hypothetical protein
MEKPRYFLPKEESFCLPVRHTTQTSCRPPSTLPQHLPTDMESLFDDAWTTFEGNPLTILFRRMYLMQKSRMEPHREVAHLRLLTLGCKHEERQFGLLFQSTESAFSLTPTMVMI